MFHIITGLRVGGGGKAVGHLEGTKLKVKDNYLLPHNPKTRKGEIAWVRSYL